MVKASRRKPRTSRKRRTVKKAKRSQSFRIRTLDAMICMDDR
jgi:hypothetical protein